MVVKLASKPATAPMAQRNVAEVVSGSDDTSVTSNFSIHDESSNATASISDTLSENQSLDTLSTTSSHEVGRDDVATNVDSLPLGVFAGDAARGVAARRRHRNDPFRHYTKRRRKKKPFSRIKQRGQSKHCKLNPLRPAFLFTIQA